MKIINTYLIPSLPAYPSYCVIYFEDRIVLYIYYESL